MEWGGGEITLICLGGTKASADFWVCPYLAAPDLAAGLAHVDEDRLTHCSEVVW